jgi:hypothetical protein
MLQNFLDQFRERKSATSNEHRGELERAISRTAGTLAMQLAMTLAGRSLTGASTTACWCAPGSRAVA